LRTQNPRMYKALEKYCISTYPTTEKPPEEIRAIQKEYASYLDCKADERGVVKGCYGELFYGEEPCHGEVSPLFEDLGLDIYNGDAILTVGLRDDIKNL